MPNKRVSQQEMTPLSIDILYLQSRLSHHVYEALPVILRMLMD